MDVSAKRGQFGGRCKNTLNGEDVMKYVCLTDVVKQIDYKNQLHDVR